MSILDYKRDTLSPQIWEEDESLKPTIKNFIYKSLDAFFEEINVSGEEEFVKGVYIGSSLATYYYTEESDLDIKVVVDISKLKFYNESFGTYDDETILEYLVDKGRNSAWLTAVIPGTLHVLDFYFYSTKEFTKDKLIKYDSLYAVHSNQWVKDPKNLRLDSSPSFILDKAKEKASDYIENITLDITKTKRDIIDFYILLDYLKTLDKDDLQKFYNEVYRILEKVNESVKELVNDKKLIKQLRHESFNKKELDNDLERFMESLNYSDGNLIFKVLQRYGLIRVLHEISQIFKDRKVTIDEIDDLADILNKF